MSKTLIDQKIHLDDLFDVIIEIYHNAVRYPLRVFVLDLKTLKEFNYPYSATEVEESINLINKFSYTKDFIFGGFTDESENNMRIFHIEGSTSRNEWDTSAYSTWGLDDLEHFIDCYKIVDQRIYEKNN